MTDITLSLSDVVDVELRRLGRRCKWQPAQMLQLAAVDLAGTTGADPAARALILQWLAVRCPPRPPRVRTAKEVH